MNLKNICLILLIIGVLAIGAVSAENKVTVDGVDFVLDDSITPTLEQDTLVNFKVKDGMTGYITTTSEGDDLDSYIKNDTELGYTVSEVPTTIGNITEYAFIDEDLGDGYFIAFEKDDKQFIYLIQGEGMSSDEDISQMAELMVDFTIDNKDLQPI